VPEEFCLDGGEWADGHGEIVALADPQAPPAPTVRSYARPSARRSGQQPLYFDLETVPDYSRLESFGLEPLPPIPDEDPISKMPDPAKVVLGTVDEIKKTLERFACPPGPWLDQVAAAEQQAKDKPRAGVFDCIEKARGKRQSVVGQHDERRKLLATTPEFCSIAAMGWAIGDGPVNSAVVGEKYSGNPASGVVTERAILEQFWSLIAHYDNVGCSPLICFNGLSFDLPVMFVRSALLGVPSSKMLDLKPWGRDVVDLYAIRFPKPGASGDGKPRKLKALAPLYGIEVPAGDVDGGDVERLMRECPDKVGEYVRSDITITRAWHKSLAGYFWQ